jgi:hypothetical protein
MMVPMLSRRVLLVVCLIIALVTSDMGYYEDTVAMDSHDLYLIIKSAPTIEIQIYTSTQYLAGTIDNVYATFSGDFSVSGPHLLGTFMTGTMTKLSIPLDRVIGKLQRVIFSTDGTDGWLYSTVICRLQGYEYVLSGPRQWLTAFNPVSFREHGDGYAAVDNVLPVSESLLLNVTSFGAIVPDGPGVV